MAEEEECFLAGVAEVLEEEEDGFDSSPAAAAVRRFEPTKRLTVLTAGVAGQVAVVVDVIVAGFNCDFTIEHSQSEEGINPTKRKNPILECQRTAATFAMFARRKFQFKRTQTV